MSDAVFYCNCGRADENCDHAMSDFSSWGSNGSIDSVGAGVAGFDDVSDSSRSSSSSESSLARDNFSFWNESRLIRHEIKFVKKHFKGRNVESTAIEIFEPARTTEDMPLPPWDFIEKLIKGALLFYFPFFFLYPTNYSLVNAVESAVTKFVFLVRSTDVADWVVSKALEQNWGLLYLGPSIEMKDFNRATLSFFGDGGCSFLIMTEEQLRGNNK